MGPHAGLLYGADEQEESLQVANDYLSCPLIA